MKCCFPTVAQCRNRAPNLEATCVKGSRETFTSLSMPCNKACKWCSERHQVWVNWQVFQRVSLEMSRCANWTAVPVKPLYRRWHSVDGETLASPEGWLCEAATAPLKNKKRRRGKEKKKKQSTAPQKPQSHFVILWEAISPALHLALAYSLTLRCGWWQSKGSIYLSFHLGQVSLCSNRTLVAQWPDDWPEKQAEGTLASPAVC